MGNSNGNATTKLLGGCTGKGFLPGQSGNPAGRAPSLRNLVRERVGDGEEPIGVLVAVMRGEKVGRRRPSIKERVEAAKELLDRGWGRSVQQMEVHQLQPIEIVPPREEDEE